jgi:hypothetical protein
MLQLDIAKTDCWDDNKIFYNSLPFPMGTYLLSLKLELINANKNINATLLCKIAT